MIKEKEAQQKICPLFKETTDSYDLLQKIKNRFSFAFSFANYPDRHRFLQ